MDKIEEFVEKAGAERKFGDLNEAETEELASLLFETGSPVGRFLGSLMRSKHWKQNSETKE